MGSSGVESAERVKFEVCLDSVEGVRVASANGADRVELCANLVEGGTTPSIGTVELARAAAPSIGLVVLVRPRGGDFLYSDDEFEVMCRDVERVRSAGADAVAIGMLCADGTIDVPRMRALIERARPMQVTCHRAFDMTRDPFEALDALTELGVDRILTSGQAKSVPEGLDCIRSLVERAGGAPIIMPGCGIRPHNVAEVVAATGVSEVHGSAGELRDSGMSFRNLSCAMGGGVAPGEFEVGGTAAVRVAAMVTALETFRSSE